MKKGLSITLFCLLNIVCIGQVNPASGKSQWADIAATAGMSKGAVAASYVYAWNVGKRKRIEMGIGARLTTAFGQKVEYITAPASLARTSTVPFLIVFSGQQVHNFDTLTVQMPLTNSLNVTANFGYHLSSKWRVGFNIDLIGFTFGSNSAAILSSHGITTTEPVAKPAGFNVLFTGDLDYGSLNSEFFLSYKLNDRWAVRAIYQFLFTEYKTTTSKQIAPDGTTVYRFRNKANNLGAGVSFYF